MQEYTQRSAFGYAIAQAKSAGLNSFMTITEVRKSRKACLLNSPWKESEQVQILISGDINKAQAIRQFAQQHDFTKQQRSSFARPVELDLQEEYQVQFEEGREGRHLVRAGSDSSVEVSIKLKAGSRFPQKLMLQRMSYDEPVYFTHTPGTVMVFIVWGTSYLYGRDTMQLIQVLQESNSELWSKQVRFVVLGLNYQKATTNYIDRNHFTAFEYFHEHNGTTPFSSILDNRHSMLVYLVDKEGIVDQIIPFEDFLPEHLQRSINRILMDVKEPPKQTPNDTPLVNSERIEKMLSNLPAPTIPFITIESVRLRTSDRGTITTTYRPVTVTGTVYGADQLPSLRQKIAKEITSSLQPSEYVVNITSANRAVGWLLNYLKLEQRLRQHNFDLMPIIRVKRSLSMRSQSSWQEGKRVIIPDVPFSSMEVYNCIRMVAEVPSDNQCGKWEVSQGLPLSCIGQKFLGINDLRNIKTGLPCAILPQEGILQFIVFFNKRTEREFDKYLQKIKQIVLSQPGRARLHLLVPEKSAKNLVLNLGSPDIITYVYPQNISDMIKVYLPTSNSVLVVDRKGIVSSCQQKDFSQDLRRLVGNPEEMAAVRQPISKTFQEMLVGFPQSQLFQETKVLLRRLPYNYTFDIVYVEDYFDIEMTKKVAYNPEIHLLLREQERLTVAPLINQLRSESLLLQDIIQTVELPLGTQCVDCKIPLQLPHYYFFVSNTHRCCDCVEQRDPNPQKLKRYPALENSVLIIKDRVVDVQRLGFNIQPQAENECIENVFICDSCRGGSDKNARYICMGCRREPNNQDYIDFCFTCAKILRGNDEAAKQNILQRCAQHNHSAGHPLLRVLYRPLDDYYRF